MIWETLLAALIQVESGGDPRAINKHENALGILQIRECVVEDVNRLYSLEYEHSDILRYRNSEAHSRDICKLYLTYWGARYEGKTGRVPTYEVYARIWNGGPKGYKKEATVGYWKKVEAEILKIRREGNE